MAVIALASARGAPGVTTTALAMALSWPRPVLLLEADVSGGSAILAGYLRGSTRHDTGLVDLAAAHRAGTLADGLRDASIPLPNSSVRLVPGLTWPTQAVNLQPVWEPLAAALHGLERIGADVIVDAGRLGTVHGPAPLLRHADAVLLLTRTTLPAVAAARARLKVLRDDLANEGTGEDALALLLVGEGQPYNAREIRDHLGAPVTAAVAWDPVHAEVFSIGAAAGRHFQDSSLVRSIRAVNAAVQGLVATRRARLAPSSAVEEGDPSHV